MWGINNIILPGFNLMTTVIGNVIGFIKTAIRTVANFFIDVINTPINLINNLLGLLKNAPLVGDFFKGIGNIPTLGYLSFAQGTPPGGAPGGLAMVGDNPYGPELVTTGGKQFLVSAPTLTLLNPGDKVRPVGPGGANPGGNTITVHAPIYLTVTGQPDDATVEKWRYVAKEVFEEAIAGVGQGTANVRAFGG